MLCVKIVKLKQIRFVYYIILYKITFLIKFYNILQKKINSLFWILYNNDSFLKFVMY